jgi:hypothetical protein
VLDALEFVEREQARLDASLATLLCAAPHDADCPAKSVLHRLSTYLLAEEQCLYPALFVTLGSATPLELLADHLALKGMVAELSRAEAPEASFADRVSNLQDRLHRYGEREQHCLFPLMRTVFSAGELQLIAGEMQLFVSANRRSVPTSTATSKALLEGVRALLASPAPAAAAQAPQPGAGRPESGTESRGA